MAKESKPVIRKGNYTFDYFFTEQELEAKSKELAKNFEELSKLEADKKAEMDKFKTKIDSKYEEMQIKAQHIRDGKEQKTKTCDIEYDFANGLKIYFFNGDIVGKETMDKKDYQLEADLPASNEHIIP